MFPDAEVKSMSLIGRRLLFWSPRILCLAFAVFLSQFALDVFNEGYSFLNTIRALMIHLIPAAIIVAALLVAWRWEWTGAVIFPAAAAFYSVRVLPRHPSWALIMSVPLVVIAGLFLANWLKRSELRPSH